MDCKDDFKKLKNAIYRSLQRKENPFDRENLLNHLKIAFPKENLSDIEIVKIGGKSQNVVDTLRGFLGDTIGIYYPILAIGCVLISLYLAVTSKYADVKLGDTNRPLYSNFKWGTYIHTLPLGSFGMRIFVILAVYFAFMIHVRQRQIFYEACRPLLGNKVDVFWGR